ncbi:MAG: pyruvate kinase [Deltaproteobacteria bacterium CG23_combo_of_CG06-09_8_20_14_all_60_8]|nr:MAG: pyruvate kinase [Deltaproteobacteria bacterium CG23_combo_of_CG06-09_8_20_14_all_60_8]
MLVNITSRRTKIVATVGPACAEEETFAALLAAGVNACRLNFSHGAHAEKKQWIERIRAHAARQGKNIAILGDLQGPKIRTGHMAPGGVILECGGRAVVTTRDVVGNQELISTCYAPFPQEVRPGDRILMNDGFIELEAVRTLSSEDVECRVITGGALGDFKGINLPGVRISTPALTEKDRQDLEFCMAEGLDYVALSFVRNAEDVADLKKILYENGADLRVIAKIERPEAVEGFDAILEAADGIMVARGDLGVEMRPERVPLIQKRIIRQCNLAGKPVITATQMLESMIKNPRPTRAETSDIANAVLDGSDAVMLSGETAVGAHPVAAVTVVAQVALDVEQDSTLRAHRHVPSASSGYREQPEAIGRAACRTAEEVEAAAILAFTQTGSIAAILAKYRPSVPIIAVTPSRNVQRRMALYSGVSSLLVASEGTTEEQICTVEKTVLAHGDLKKGDVVVITMGSPISATGTTNLMKVHRLGTSGFYEVY